MAARKNYFKQRQRKKYRSRSYKNPLFNQVKKEVAWKRFVVPVLVVVGISGLTIFFLSHEMFRFSKVEILGTEYIDTVALEASISDYTNESVKLFFNRTNQFLFSTDVLQTRLLDGFALAEVVVSTQEDTIHISLEERTSNLIWITDATAYVADLNGVISREVSTEMLTAAFGDSGEVEDTKEIRQLRELPLFYDLNDIRVDVGSIVLKEDEVEHILALHEGLRTLEVPFLRTEIDRLAGKWMRVVTEDGYGILFDALGDIDAQLQNLDVVLREQVEDRGSLEYIDLRFGDRVYFK
jgi:hypothetical protein